MPCLGILQLPPSLGVKVTCIIGFTQRLGSDTQFVFYEAPVTTYMYLRILSMAGCLNSLGLKTDISVMRLSAS